MTSHTDVYNYSITLPVTGDPEVLEWFEFIHANGDLSLELVKLVQNYINSNLYETPQDFSPPSINTSLLSSQDDLLDSLYNCDGAAGAIFCEEKKVKKKMLSV